MLPWPVVASRIVALLQQSFNFATNAAKRSALAKRTYSSKRLCKDCMKRIAIYCSNMTELPIVFTFVHFSHDKGSIFRCKSAPPDCRRPNMDISCLPLSALSVNSYALFSRCVVNWYVHRNAEQTPSRQMSCRKTRWGFNGPPSAFSEDGFVSQNTSFNNIVTPRSCSSFLNPVKHDWSRSCGSLYRKRPTMCFCIYFKTRALFQSLWKHLVLAEMLGVAQSNSGVLTHVCTRNRWCNTCSTKRRAVVIPTRPMKSE